MPSFDISLSDRSVGIDFNKYVNMQRLLAYKNWPPNLVPQEELAAALADQRRLAEGWFPGKADLKDAPLITEWSFVDRRGAGQGLYIQGYVNRHPRLGRRTLKLLTSHVVAIDRHNQKWVRTLSRFYRLGDPA
jgi:hypothetical protein